MKILATVLFWDLILYEYVWVSTFQCSHAIQHHHFILKTKVRRSFEMSVNIQRRHSVVSRQT